MRTLRFGKINEFYWKKRKSSLMISLYKDFNGKAKWWISNSITHWCLIDRGTNLPIDDFAFKKSQMHSGWCGLPRERNFVRLTTYYMKFFLEVKDPDTLHRPPARLTWSIMLHPHSEGFLLIFFSFRDQLN